MANYLADKQRELSGRFLLRKDLFLELISLKDDIPTLNIPKRRNRVFLSHGLGGASDVELQKIDNTIHIGIHPQKAIKWHATSWRTLVAFYYWYINCDENVGTMLLNCSDGDAASIAQFSPSSFSPNAILLPDYLFFLNRAYEKFGRLAATNGTDWNARSDEIVWRGSLFGNGYFNYETKLAEHSGVNQRVRLAQKTKDTEIDFKFVYQKWHRADFPIVMRAGLAGDRIAEESWVDRKYAIDIDGYTNAWSNLFIRMKLGCCVFKVASDYGYKQWYYDDLIPFEHYIPVKADLSDLFEKIEWAKSNRSKAREIAAAGQAFVNKMTFETETREAVRRIEENCTR